MSYTAPSWFVVVLLQFVCFGRIRKFSEDEEALLASVNVSNIAKKFKTKEKTCLLPSKVEWWTEGWSPLT